MPFPLRMVCIYVLRLLGTKSSKSTLSVVVTARGHRDDSFCVFEHILHTRITVFSTFITDLILLVLMFAGILRWKGAHERGGLWWLMYTQVSLAHPTLISLLMLIVRVWHGL